MTGFPMLLSWIFSYQSWVLSLTALTILSLAVLLWFYFRTFQGVWIPLLSGSLSTLWALGFAGLLGFTIDLLMIVVFLLITVRALSHSVQSMERYHEEYFRLGDKQAAIGSGSGVDYGYYVLSRITEEYSRFADVDQAIEEALMTTGRAILFTGATLTASVIFWLFFPMRFQAEMALLLTLILFLHIVGALLFIPAMVSLFKPRFATAGAAQHELAQATIAVEPREVQMARVQQP
jgi:predicted RND superfamily exporter protein